MASVTYNLEIYPKMLDFLNQMKSLNLQKRTIGIIENGSWAPQSGELMSKFMDDMKLMDVLGEEVSLASSLNDVSYRELREMADAIAEQINGKK